MDDGKWYWFDLTWGDASTNTYTYFCVLDQKLSTHTPDPSGQLGMYVNILLPERADSAFSSDDMLEIGEKVTVNGSKYVLCSAGKLRLIQGTAGTSEKLVYNGVVYNIA